MDVLVFFLAVMTCCFCQENALQAFPAVIHEVCPSAEERAAIREQISAVIRERISKFLLTNFSNCCEVCITYTQVRPIRYAVMLQYYIQVKEFSFLADTGKYNVRSCNSSEVSATNQAYCDMETDGGGWLVIQRRIENGTVDFYRNWTDYVQGFGDLEGEFWYGLENIHCLTTQDDVELRIELGNGTIPSIVWTYQLFRVGGASTKYTLTIGEGTGVGGTYDAMAYSNGRAFTTPDMDNDHYIRNCAVLHQGPWWHSSCTYANLNSRHEHGSHSRIYWYNGDLNYFNNVEMKIRPKRCTPTTTN